MHFLVQEDRLGRREVPRAHFSTWDQGTKQQLLKPEDESWIFPNNLENIKCPVPTGTDCCTYAQILLVPSET